MSLAELQRAALTPFLWRQRISRNVIKDLDKFYADIDASPYEARYIAPEPLFLQAWYMRGDVVIVPGGRFIICAAIGGKKGPGRINLYDLGCPRELQARRVRNVVASTQFRERAEQCTFSIVPQGSEKLRSVLVMSRSVYESACNWV